MADHLSEYPDQLWRSLADLSGLLLSEESRETTLRRVADLAVRSVASCDAAAVTLFDDGKPGVGAATGGLVYEVDRYQYEIGEGPCLQTMLDREVIEVEDMATEQRWQRFCRHASERGIRSSLSFPLLVRGEALGALNLYASAAGAFTSEDRETGTMFAAQVSVSLVNLRTYAASVEQTRQLRDALDSRAIIDQAMGILMGENGYDQEGAFDDLRTASQSSNRKLKEVAHEVVRAASNRPAKAKKSRG